MYGFIDIIRDYFKGNEQDTVNNVWNKWGKQYITNRVQEQLKPVGPKETNSILYFMIELKDQFSQMVEILCNGHFKVQIDGSFIYILRNSTLTMDFRDVVLKLITYLLDFSKNNIFFDNELKN